MNMTTMIKQLKAKQAKMAKLRDELREFLSEVEDEESRMSDALENIEIAIDRLSESV